MAPDEKKEKFKYYWGSLTDEGKRYFEISAGKRQRNSTEDEGPAAKLAKFSSSACNSVNQLETERCSSPEDPQDVKKRRNRSELKKKSERHNFDNKELDMKVKEHKSLKKKTTKPKVGTIFLEELPKTRFNIPNQKTSKKSKAVPNTFGRRVVGGKKKPHNSPVLDENVLTDNEKPTGQSNSFALHNEDALKIKCMQSKKLHSNEKHSKGSKNDLNEISEIRSGNAKRQSVESRSKLITPVEENLESFPYCKSKKLSLASNSSSSKESKQSCKKLSLASNSSSSKESKQPFLEQTKPNNVNVFKKEKIVSECNIEPKFNDCVIEIDSSVVLLPSNTKLTSNSLILNNSKLPCKEKREQNTNKHPKNIHFNEKLPNKQKKLDENGQKFLKDAVNRSLLSKMEDKKDLRQAITSISPSLKTKLISSSEFLEVKDLKLKKEKKCKDKLQLENHYNEQLLFSEQQKKGMNMQKDVKINLPKNPIKTIFVTSSNTVSPNTSKMSTSQSCTNFELKVKDKDKNLHQTNIHSNNKCSVIKKTNSKGENLLKPVSSQFSSKQKRNVDNTDIMKKDTESHKKVLNPIVILKKVSPTETQPFAEKIVCKKQEHKKKISSPAICPDKGENLPKPVSSQFSSKQKQNVDKTDIMKKKTKSHEKVLSPIVVLKKISPIETQPISEKIVCKKQEHKSKIPSPAVCPDAAKCPKDSVKTEVDDDDDIIICWVAPKPKAVPVSTSSGQRCTCGGPGYFKCNKCLQLYCAHAVCQLQDKCRVEGGFLRSCLPSQEFG